jgi:hypothetical protein
MIKLARKIAAELVIDGEKTRHFFDTSKLDKGLIRLQKEMFKAGVTGADSKMPPEMIENLINIYEESFSGVEGYEMEEGGHVEPDIIPPAHKIQVISGLVSARLGGPSKNSKPASEA